jgi:uncharacterized damage-inducible protein DinB
MTAQEARRHLRYSAWASRRVLDAVMALPEEQRGRDLGSSHKGLLGTLDHILFGDRVWIERMLGTPIGASGEPIEVEWPKVQKRWDDWASSVTDDDLMRVIDYRDLRGAARQSAASEIVMHVVNHATLHRGQVMSMLRQLGIAPPQTDLIAFYREEKTEEAHA